VQKLQQEVTNLRQKVQSAEQRAQTQHEPDVDLEELPAEQQRAARTEVEQELQEANKRIDELEQALSQAEGTPSGLAVGSTAWVRKAGGQGLNRRDAPGLNSNVQDSLAIGTQLTLQEGPVQADGYTWWRVQASDGRVGWVAGEELVTQPE
jgi:cytoskeletal protein RodZ